MVFVATARMVVRFSEDKFLSAALALVAPNCSLPNHCIYSIPAPQALQQLTLQVLGNTPHILGQSVIGRHAFCYNNLTAGFQFNNHGVDFCLG